MTADTQTLVAEIASAADQVVTLHDALAKLGTAGEVEARLVSMARAVALAQANDIENLAEAL